MWHHVIGLSVDEVAVELHAPVGHREVVAMSRGRKHLGEALASRLGSTGDDDMTAWLSAARDHVQGPPTAGQEALLGGGGAVVLAVAGTTTSLVVSNDPRRAYRTGRSRSPSAGSHIGARIGSTVELVGNSIARDEVGPISGEATWPSRRSTDRRALKRTALLTDQDGNRPNVLDLAVQPLPALLGDGAERRGRLKLRG